MWNRCSSIGVIKVLFRAAEKQIKGEGRSAHDGWAPAAKATAARSSRLLASKGMGASAMLWGTKAISIEKRLWGSSVSGCLMTFTDGKECVLEREESPEQWFLKLFLRSCIKDPVGGWVDRTLAPPPTPSPLLQPE